MSATALEPIDPPAGVEAGRPPLAAATTGAGVAATTGAAAATLDRSVWIVLAIVLIAEVMDLLDATVVTIAAPAIRGDLGGGTTTLQWLTAGYTLSFAVFLITGGRLGDMFGRRRLFVLGAAGFTATSLTCSLASTPGMLLAARVLQGGFGALMIPQGLGVLKMLFPGTEIGKAFSVFGPVMGLSALAAPVLGGWLVDADLLGTGWRMIFLLNLPLGLAAVLGALRFMPHSRADETVRLDLRGVALTAAGLSCVIYPLVQGREAGWPAWCFAMLAAGVALLVAFVAIERRPGNNGLIEASLLRNRAYVSGLVVVIFFTASFIGLMLVVSLFAQLGLRYSPLHAGLTLAPMSLGVAIAAGASYPLMARFGRRLIHTGLLIDVVAMGALAATVHHYSQALTTWEMAPAMLAGGLGLGLVFGPLFNVILAGVRDREVGSASGTLNAVQQVGTALGIAVIGTIFFALLDAGRTSPAAMTWTTLIAGGLFAVTALLVFALPRQARADVV